MPIDVQAPDGSIARFPDGTADAVIEKAMAAQFGGPKPKPGKREIAKDIGKSGATGVGQGFSGMAGARGDAVVQTENLLRKVGMGKAADAVERARLNPTSALNSGLGGLITLSPSGLSPVGAPAVTSAEINKGVGLTYEPKTTAGKYARTVGQMAPNALLPGGLIRRTAQVVAPGLISEGAGQTAEALGASPGVAGGARVAGAIVGGGAAGARAGLIPKIGREPVGLIESKMGVNVDAATAETQRLRDAGVRPNLIDVAGEKGRRVLRAAGTKSLDAGEVLQNNARGVIADTKPAVMDRTRQTVTDPRTADQMVADILDARSKNATVNYKDAYETPVSLSDEVKAVLSDGPGQTALRRARRAAEARQDTQRMSEIDGLLSDTAPDSVSAATLDRTQIALGKQSKRLKKNEGGDIASGLDMRRGVINSALDEVEELAPARTDYKAKSQAAETLGYEGKRSTAKDVFSTDPTDYAAWHATLSDEAKAANAVRLRQDILDTLGGQRKSSMGSIEQLVDSQYAKSNLRTALGADAADTYLANTQARLDQLRNANFVSPNAGSRTAVLENDTNALSGLVEAGKLAVDVKSGNWLGAGGKIADYLGSIGISEKAAKDLAEMAVDPDQLDAVLSYLNRNKGSAAAQQFLAYRKSLLAAGAGSAALTAQPAAAAPQEDQTPALQ